VHLFVSIDENKHVRSEKWSRSRKCQWKISISWDKT